MLRFSSFRVFFSLDFMLGAAPNYKIFQKLSTYSDTSALRQYRELLPHVAGFVCVRHGYGKTVRCVPTRAIFESSWSG